MRIYLFVSLGLFFLLDSSGICSAETAFAGRVKTVENNAFVVRNGHNLAAFPGMTIQMGDIVKTGDRGQIGLIFTDDTIISMGSKSEIAIEEYLFESVDGQMSFVTKMIRGTIAFISGQISKLSPGSVRVETPAATIGVRGTQFLVKVED